MGIVVEVFAPDPEQAHDICALAARNLFYARNPFVMGTAGNASFWSDEVMKARSAFTWTLNHIIAVDDPLSFCRIETEDVSGQAPVGSGIAIGGQQ